MKFDNLRLGLRALRNTLFAACAVFTSGVYADPDKNFFTNAITDGTQTIDLGEAGHTKSWAIFALTGGVTATNTTLNPLFYDAIGNVGVAGGNMSMISSQVKGDLWLKTTATLSSSGGSSYTGSLIQSGAGNTVLSNGFSNANSANASATAMAATVGSLANISLNNTPLTISAAAGVTYVMKLTDLVLSGAGAVLTLNGTNTTNFVINISRYLALSAGAKIVLTGGLKPQNVLLNVGLGYTFDVTLGGGSLANAIILAPNRTVKLTGASRVFGEVIGKSVSLSGASQVQNPLASP